MKPKPKRAARLDADGVPIDPDDWDYEDWRLLWSGMRAIEAMIAARHRAKAEAETGGNDGST